MTELPDSPERLRRLREMFDAVMDQAPADRASFLDRELSGDPALRDELESLITVSERTDERLAPPLGSFAAGGGSLVGRRLGPYDVVRLVGRGGMGTVYEAVRADDQYRKRVAIKVVQAGPESDLTLARFRRERQILANLEHPNIATLLDGGVAPDGRPFLVMEYVDGEPITSWCDGRSLPVRDRIALFRQVCGAVGHAHRNLVVHRDLKPGNIFVTADGTVKLLDFGIAKLLGDTGDDALPLTRGGARAFTPEYASPEQIEGNALTTASDVYSLGVVLFELLAGRRPHGSEEAVLSRPIPLPSAVVEPGAAGPRHERDAGQLGRRLRGELDQIVLMALRREPERRYPSVEALDDDLKRYLEGLPVKAQRDRAAYRFGKFVRRNRAAVAAGVVALAALLGGTAAALWQARAASREALRATRISEFLQGILGSGIASVETSRRFSQANLTVREVLDTAAGRLTTELAAEPMVRAQLHRIIAGAYFEGMNLGPARQQLESALAIHRRELGPRDLEVARDLAGVAQIMAELHPDSAEAVAEQALAIYRLRHAPDTLSDYMAALGALAGAQSYRGELAAAESTFSRYLAAERARSKPRLQVIGVALGALGYLQHNQGKYDIAEITMRHGIAALDSAGSDPSFEEAGQLMTLGSHLTGKGKAADGLRVLQRAREMARFTHPPESPFHPQVGILIAEALSLLGDTAQAHAEARAALAAIARLPAGSELVAFQSEWRYALMLRREGASAEAERAARLQYATGLASAKPFPYYLADTEFLLGGILSDRGKYAEAEGHLLASYRIASDRLGPTHARTIRAIRELTQLYLRWGRPSDAGEWGARLSSPVVDSLRRKVSAERVRRGPSPS
jgi:serine/threonine-protein kinase